ncbi:NAD(P)H-binding protein [Demequina lignilytica]|uniref:NAD(P)H-binding protein n=1 Tax=Demequina lignilytica TaxID=3051663 RepID=A0AAW7MAI4_9MICO|nr:MULTISPECIES: NAD(P)H-binding protein [unclassified Demequina]MDN4479146.1 NAD(P)H-binding protein [Demequina sp. SYSU T00039-1]MDN4482584.1 NAD(P)H-binding protein [Demequina sp. SYSU T0a273]MDN4489141.1 NAD(P)H-binding protein [Demequina sp. SYSU T00039]MDN4490244.1 NAD(P)H-binding protein [Demequina sp. SYSU T00068]
MTTYAVTGASGQLGEKIVRALLDLHLSPFDVVALARDTDKVEELAALGVRTREADYDRPETLATALEGVDRLVLVSASEPGRRLPQHVAVIEAAEAAGVSRIVYTSILKADTTSNALAPEHLATEERLTASPIETVALRNSWYIENYTGQVPGYVERGAIVGATDGAVISAATRQDFAEAAAAAVTADAVKPVYELAGVDFTLADLAATVTAASGTEVTYTNVTVDQLAAGMVEAGLDEGTAGFWASIDASIAQGDLQTGSTDLVQLIGRAPTSLEAAVKAAV